MTLPHVNLTDANIEAWPALPQSEWSGTCATLQLWMQVVGKIRLALCLRSTTAGA